MKKHIKILSVIKQILSFVIFVMPASLFSQGNSESVLLKLDNAIENSDLYTQQRENRIQNYKKKLLQLKSHSLEEYDLNSLIYKEYKPYMCDSAILYKNKNIEIATLMHDSSREYESKIDLAYLLGSVGLYKEATDLLESIDQSKLPDYLHIAYYDSYLRVYGELAYYSQDKNKSKIYWKVFDAKLLALKSILTHDHHLYVELKEDSTRNAHNYVDALKLNDYLLAKTTPNTVEYALVTFRRSLIYKLDGDKENQKYYLTLSAIADIRSAIKDQASLMMLAQILYEEGNIDRAYKYIRFSWNATMFYSAKLRSLQSSSILSLIDKTYQTKIESQKSELQRYLILISSLSVLLVLLLLIIYRQIKKLSITKTNLQNANADLSYLNSELKNLNLKLTEVNKVLFDTNNELTESNKIKEVYIGRFIELCSAYINKIDDFRKKVHNKIKDGNIKEAKIMTQSQDIMDVEFEELYANFDTAFLQLFPNFVEKVNELLNENDKFVLKKGEILNPELRIMALMRLGISDGNKISQFLRYSLTTVYNYRTKSKNRTHLHKEEFDNQIQQIS